MPVADRIRKLGFRRWHECQLIEAHASLVTAFLSVIVVVACMDQLHWHDAGLKPLILLALIGGGIVLCYKTVMLYFKLLFCAEHYAQQAVCGKCNTYGVIEVLSSSIHGAAEITDAVSSDWLKVRCRKCGHGWTMTADQAQTPMGKAL